MNADYFGYFRDFFGFLWTFLISPVPVLNLPWITLFGGSLIVGVLLSALDKLLGFSSNTSFSDVISYNTASDKAEKRYQRSQRDQDARWQRHHKKG